MRPESLHLSDMIAFRDACEASNPIRLEIQRDGVSSEVAFDTPAVVIGRDNRADLTLLDDEVGSRHLYFQLIRGRLYAVHLADRANTYHSGKRWIAGWVYPGHEFKIGSITLRILGPNPPPTEHLLAGDNPLVPNRSQAPVYAFEPLTSRSNPPRRFFYRQELLLIGRVPPCRLVVRHPDVSRCHAAVIRTARGMWILDLLSRSGVAVNGVPVSAAELKAGDRVEFGRVGVRVCGPETLNGKASHPTTALIPDTPGLHSFDRNGEPVFDQVAALQQQTFEQFQELLASMMQMVGGILNEQREFVREELERLERLIVPVATPALPAAAGEYSAEPILTPASDPMVTTAPSSATPPPRPAAIRPSLDEAQLHAWLEQQLGTLNRQQSAAWERLVNLLRGR